jgi:type I restriction enzyme S subunit
VAAAGGSTFKELSRGTAKLLPILLPPLDEQRRIAEVLRSVDEAIVATSDLARQTDELWHTMAETAIWRLAVAQPDCVRQLSQAISASDYGVNASLTSEPIGQAILRMGNIQDGQIDPTDMKWAVIQAGEAHALPLDVGDILFNRTNSRDLVGKVALVREPTDCLYASYIVRLRVNVAVADPYYVFAVMHSRRAQAQFKSIATPGVSQSNINPTNLKKQMIPLPPLGEQQVIAGQLRAVEVTRQSLRHELATLRQIKADVMSDLLSGHVRVPA